MSQVRTTTGRRVFVAPNRPRDTGRPTGRVQLIDRAAAATQNLTHMSLEADAHVIGRLPARLTLTHMSYSTAGNRPDADRRRRHMLRYRPHGGPIGR